MSNLKKIKKEELLQKLDKNPKSNKGFFSIEVEWFSRFSGTRPEIKKNPKKFLNLIENIDSSTQMAWVVYYK